MNRFMVAAIVIGIVSGCGSSGPGATANPTLGTPPSQTPTPSSAPSIQDIWGFELFAPLEPGTYFIDPDLDPSTPLRVVYEVPAEEWSMWKSALQNSPRRDTSP